MHNIGFSYAAADQTVITVITIQHFSTDSYNRHSLYNNEKKSITITFAVWKIGTAGSIQTCKNVFN